MAEIKVPLFVADPGGILANFDQIQVHRSQWKTGPFTEITTATPPTKKTSRLLLSADERDYEYIDECGDSTYFYKARFFNSNTLAVSSFTEPVQGEADSALDILSIEDLQTNFLFGVDLTKDDGQVYPDSMLQFYIKSAVSWLEMRLDIPIRPALFHEEHDYFRRDYEKYIFIKTDKRPIIEVQKVSLVLPTQQVVQTFDNSWLHVQKDMGMINVVPGAGTAGTILLGAAGGFLPLFYSGNNFIPHVFHVDYRAGFESGKVPPILYEVIGKIASLGPLNIAGDLIAGAGIAAQSLSVDGLSQSISTTASATNAGYGARIIQYQKDVKAQIPVLRSYFHGITMTVA